MCHLAERVGSSAGLKDFASGKQVSIRTLCDCRM